MCESFLQYIGQSKRLMPELVNFLTSVVGYFAVDGTGILASQPPCTYSISIISEYLYLGICLPPLTGKVSHMSSLLSVEGGESIPT